MMELVKGDQVKVTGERGEFTVMSTKTEGDGRIVVTVWGGAGGRQSIRTFYRERVKQPKKRRRDVPRQL